MLNICFYFLFLLLAYSLNSYLLPSKKCKDKSSATNAAPVPVSEPSSEAFLQFLASHVPETPETPGTMLTETLSGLAFVFTFIIFCV